MPVNTVPVHTVQIEEPEYKAIKLYAKKNGKLIKAALREAIRQFIEHPRSQKRTR